MVTEEFKTQIYKEYHTKVLSYLKMHLYGDDIAEDLCSEVFYKVYEKIDTFDESKASISTWIYTIARNKMTDYFRVRKVTSEIPETYEDGSDIEEDVCNSETLDTLADALESLEERERNIIILRFYTGLTLKEIAERLDISYAYVKILQNKALSQMRGFFEE